MISIKTYLRVLITGNYVADGRTTERNITPRMLSVISLVTMAVFPMGVAGFPCILEDHTDCELVSTSLYLVFRDMLPLGRRSSTQKVRHLAI